MSDQQQGAAGGGAGEGRSKRRCVLRRHAVPSAAHYVGYVEDEETPEMIMRKFEEMERILAAQRAGEAGPSGVQQQPAGGEPVPPGGEAGPLQGTHGDSTTAAATAATAAAVAAAPAAVIGSEQPPYGSSGYGGFDASSGQGRNPGDPGPLGEDQLAEIFKATSLFNVKSVLKGNEALLARSGAGGRGPGAGTGEARGGGRVPGGGGTEDRAGWSDGEPCSGEEDGVWDDLRGFWSDDDSWAGGKAQRRSSQQQQQSRAKRRKPPASGSDAASAAAAAPTNSKPRGASHGLAAVTLAATAAAAAAAAATATAAAAGDVSLGLEPGVPRRNKARPADAVVHIRVPPPPLPSAWGRVVRPYGAALHFQQEPPPGQGRLEQQQELQQQDGGEAAEEGQQQALQGGSSVADPSVAACYHCVPDLCRFDFLGRLGGREFLGVMVNPGWETDPGGTPGAVPRCLLAAAPGPPAPASIPAVREALARRLATLPLPALCPRGFLFIWARKQLLSAVVSLAASWGYSYVENLTWVWQTPSNRVAAAAAPLIPSSHLTLLVLRRDGPEAKGVELRHQRSPDVVMDVPLPAPGSPGWRVPQGVYATIETLLPTARGALLELWAPAAPEHARPGWVQVAEAPVGSTAGDLG